ncbi:MAG: hypothetical protein LBN23_05885, partial [Paludibacter sp.]|nr:hypothetical protein [Paludibacter sp.]
MKKAKQIVIICACCCWAFQAAAQNKPIIDRITSINGLSHNTIRCMIQDTTGFLWFGSLNGLNRYDGARIKNISLNSQNSTALSSDKIKELHSDTRGYIWIRTYGDNIHCYNPFTEKFITLFEDKIDVPRFNLLYEDREKNMWLGSVNAGCVRISFDGDKVTARTFKHIDEGNSLPSNSVNDIFQDSQKRVWMLTTLGIRILKNENIEKHTDKRTDRISYFKAFEFDGKIFLITKNGRIDIYNPQNDFFETSVEPSGKYEIFKAMQFANDKILLSTVGAGIFIFDTKAKKTVSARNFFGEEITGNAYFQKDTYGNVWVYNYTGNVWLLKSAAAAPVKMNLIPPTLLAIIDEERFTFCGDEHGSVWITTYGNGLFCYELATGALTHFTYNNNNSNGLSSNYLLAIILDKNENIWIGTENTGVNKLSFSNRNVRLIFPDETEQKRNGNVVRTLFEDRDGAVWVATKAGSVYRYSSDFNRRQTIFENGYNVYQIIQDSVGDIWFATRGNGIARLPKGDFGKAQWYKHSDKPGSLSSNGVFSILFDRKGRLWTATFGGGLCVKSSFTDTEGFRTFFTTDDWIRFARYVFEDKRGDLWVTTSNGILRFDPDSLLVNPENHTYYGYNNSDGVSLSNPEIRQIFQDSQGRIYAATAGGGICQFVEEQGRKGYFVTYKNNHGISNDNIMAIAEDATGKLWISAENGLQTFDTETKLFQFYRFSDDFTSNLFSETAVLTCRDGRMLFGSLNGFYVFNPDNMQVTNRKNDKVTITDFYI